MTYSGTTYVQTEPVMHGEPVTVTTSNEGVTWVTQIYDEAEEDAFDATICDARRNSPTLPLWMVLHLPGWIVDFCFWVKRMSRRFHGK